VPLFILFVVIGTERSSIEVLDPKDQVPVPCIDVFLVGECYVLSFYVYFDLCVYY
jgi:hypothetical protein